MADIIYESKVEVDGQYALNTIPNTISINYGKATQALSVSSAGGGQIVYNHSANLEDAVATIKFSLQHTIDNATIVKDLFVDNLSTHTLKFTTIGGGIRTYKSVICTNNPDFTIANDGKVELEFSAAAPTVA